MTVSAIDPALSRTAIQASAERISPYVRETPVISVAASPGRAQLKLEFMQLSGTFKARGAFNRLLAAEAGSFASVATASGGNHGAAVACAAQTLGIAADIFVPEVSPPAKRRAIEQYGARIHIGGAQYADAFELCQRYVRDSDALFSHAYDMVETLQGQGTVALEWQRQSPHLDTVLVAVGGGGLIGGMAAWYRGSVRLVAVESKGCPTLHRALQAGEPVDVEVSGLAADSLGARRSGELMFPLASQFIGASVLVSDDSIQAAQAWAWQHLRTVLEPGGATALAAWLDGSYRAHPDEHVGILLCGANTALSALPV